MKRKERGEDQRRRARAKRERAPSRRPRESSKVTDDSLFHETVEEREEREQQ